jgi:hypothetical protein
MHYNYKSLKNYRSCLTNKRMHLSTIKLQYEFRIPMKVVALLKMCSNETYSKSVQVKKMSDAFSIQDSLKHGDSLSPLLKCTYWVT